MAHGDNIYDPSSLSLNHYVGLPFGHAPCTQNPMPFATGSSIPAFSPHPAIAHAVPYPPWKLHATLPSPSFFFLFPFSPLCSFLADTCSMGPVAIRPRSLVR